MPLAESVAAIAKGLMSRLRALPRGSAAIAVSSGLWLIGGLVLLFVVDHFIVGDARLRFEALQGLLEHGNLPSRDGHGWLPPAQYSLMGPLVSSPLYLLGYWIKSPRWWCERYNTILLLGFGLVLVWSLRGRIKAEAVAAVVLLLTFCSMFPNHVMGFYGEVFTTTMICSGLAVVVLKDRAWGWLLVVMGCVNTMSLAIGLALAAAFHAIKRRRLHPLLVPVAAAICILIDARIRQGRWFEFGYNSLGFAHSVLPYAREWNFELPLLVGLVSLLLSFGKGLIFFTPAFFVPLPRDTAPEVVHFHRLLQILLVGMLLVYGRFSAWSGDWYWGPRYFLLASVPSSLALGLWLKQPRAALWTRWLTLLGVALSTWVAISGVVFMLEGLGACQADEYRYIPLCWYVPDFSPLWRPILTRNWAQLARYWQFAVFAVAIFGWVSFFTWRSALSDTLQVCRSALGKLFTLPEWRF
ncbi:MAG: hypothetical protein JXR83_20020 [Deltaproteobacteria bacterium]|nr:hypothetical protein [Deltaproteobacteria bacterium]